MSRFERSLGADIICGKPPLSGEVALRFAHSKRSAVVNWSSITCVEGELSEEVRWLTEK